MVYAQDPYNSQLAPEVREASLRNKADETQKYLDEAHTLLDQLENAVHGPQPRANGPKSDGDVEHPGLRAVLGYNSATAAHLCGRLSTLIGSL